MSAGTVRPEKWAETAQEEAFFYEDRGGESLVRTIFGAVEWKRSAVKTQCGRFSAQCYYEKHGVVPGGLTDTKGEPEPPTVLSW